MVSLWGSTLHFSYYEWKWASFQMSKGYLNFFFSAKLFFMTFAHFSVGLIISRCFSYIRRMSSLLLNELQMCFSDFCLFLNCVWVVAHSTGFCFLCYCTSQSFPVASRFRVTVGKAFLILRLWGNSPTFSSSSWRVSVFFYKNIWSLSRCMAWRLYPAPVFSRWLPVVLIPYF